jgi:hypothetical protein
VKRTNYEANHENRAADDQHCQRGEISEMRVLGLRESKNESECDTDDGE